MPRPEPRGTAMRRRDSSASWRRGGWWPLAARAQQTERMRRIGVLMSLAADDPEVRPASRRSCRDCSAGLDDGRNVQIDYRWAQAMRSTFANMRRNWSRWRRTFPGHWRLERGAVAAGDTNSADRVHRSPIRSAPALSTAWRSPAATLRVSRLRIRHEREMARTAQGDRAQRDARGDHSGPHHSLRDRPVRRDPVRWRRRFGVEVRPIDVRDAERN